MTDALMNTYARLPVAFEEGRGARLWDTEGREYLDAIAGIAVCGLGHAHPAVTAAVCDQAGRLVHTSNLYRIPLQERLAQRLTSAAGMESAFFCNSGAEANEAALKIARRTGSQRGIAEPKVIVMEGSFHGRTLATLSATGNPAIQSGFEPLVAGFERVPWGDADAVAALAGREDIVAVLVEPVTGEGGVGVPPADYLPRLRAICDDADWLLMVDEIQTGIGRTGDLFASLGAGVTPDVLTLAKGLGNGVPIGACLARGTAAGILGPGSHGTTFGGSPLVSATALAVLDTMETEALPARAAELGDRIAAGLRARLGNHPAVADIRHRGLMIGVELDRPCKELVRQGLDRGLLINVTAERVVRLLPPLILSDAEADTITTTVADLIEAFAPPGGES
ncbi:acetylornithine aminotransferase [Thiohalospira halophila DSM 15071]|uniref:Acetylornithine aminotransferase n=1 Tax=Thiohalospira halophila DSM 15071 TaxID=1123397 RepID=A0A1I1Q705_9GAMM|nr:aspartate aminotransferase family protein [Thiohalospira halophila]SFD17835.1 acetylornithine aminotransferase [Thiohalospira halophila DSM 15071]